MDNRPKKFSDWLLRSFIIRTGIQNQLEELRAFKKEYSCYLCGEIFYVEHHGWGWNVCVTANCTNKLCFRCSNDKDVWTCGCEN